ncbi:hypothetical protein LCGC14_2323690, partial [marine sediment metagenome]
GKRLKHVVGRAATMFGAELSRKAGVLFTGPDEPEMPQNAAYAVLGIHPEAIDAVVKAAYRVLASEYHPDSSKNPDTAKFIEINKAYNDIMAERKEAKKDGGEK